jgi:hypothetical protein
MVRRRARGCRPHFPRRRGRDGGWRHTNADDLGYGRFLSRSPPRENSFFKKKIPESEQYHCMILRKAGLFIRTIGCGGHWQRDHELLDFSYITTIYIGTSHMRKAFIAEK